MPKFYSTLLKFYFTQPKFYSATLKFYSTLPEYPPGKHEATFHPFSSSVTLPTVSGNITLPSVLPTRSPFSTEIPSYPKSFLTRNPFLPGIPFYPKSFFIRNPFLHQRPSYPKPLPFPLFCSSVLLFFCPFLLPSFCSFLLLFFCSSVSICLYLRSKYTIGTQQSPRRPLRTHARVVYIQKTCQNNHTQKTVTPH